MESEVVVRFTKGWETSHSHWMDLISYIVKFVMQPMYRAKYSDLSHTSSAGSPYRDTYLRFVRFLTLPSGHPRNFIQYSLFLTARAHVFTPDSSMTTCNMFMSLFFK